MFLGKKAIWVLIMLLLISSVFAFGESQTLTGLNNINITGNSEDLIIVMEDEPIKFMNWLFMRTEPFSEKKSIVLENLEDEGITLKTLSKNKKNKDLKSINAVAIKINPDDKEKLKDIKGIKKILPDRILSIALDTSVPAINVTQVWQQLNASGSNLTGKDISIAILDTGIDYTHADLGGCIGSNCKVKGGYDFINDDSDPMDDNGHGTHCAGITAANGTLKGVAPDAVLYGYKVLSAGGSGSESQIIEGIERAMDPNDDDDKSDHIDILSLSLGGNGDENSALSLAVNKAVDDGAVVIVAAGNDGDNGDYTVGSPASAEKAITVGASNDNGILQSFSSRGPTSNNNIKPDVLAPGSLIKSTVPTGSCEHCSPTTYMQLSGTSMATPHVAGLAALILQNKDLSPQEVKSVITTTAFDKGYIVTRQGTGLVNALESVNAEALASPSSFSLGVNNPSLPNFQITKNITLKNLIGTTTYDFSSLSETNISINFSQDSVILNQNQEVIIQVTITANNSEILDGRHEGKVYITSGTENLTIPYMFIKETSFGFSFFSAGVPTSPGWFSVHDRVSNKWSYQNPGTTKYVALQEGYYDIITTFQNNDYIVVRENQYINGPISIDRNEAKYSLDLNLYDKDLNLINPTTSKSMWIFKYRNNIDLYRLWSMTTGGSIPETKHEKHFSNFSTNYSYNWEFPFYYDDALYEATNYVSNVSSNIVSNNTPFLNFKIYTPETTTWIKHASKSQGQTIINMQKSVSGSIDAYFTEKPTEDHSFNDVWLLSEDYITPVIQNVTSTFDLKLNNKIIDTNKTDLYFGTAPFFWYGKFDNNANAINLTSYSDSGYQYSFLTQGYSYLPYEEVPWKLYQNGVSVDSGVLSGTDEIYSLSKLANKYSLIFNKTYEINGINRTVIINNTFDTSLADSNPPSLKYFDVVVNGVKKDTLDNDNKFYFEVDPVGSSFSTVEMYYDNAGWQSIPVTKSGNLCNASLGNIGALEVNFKLRIMDSSANILEYYFTLPTSAGSDLIVSEINFVNDLLEEGQLLEINATISNIGISNATNIFADFLIDEVNIGSASLGNLTASSSNFAIKNSTTTPGLHTISILADPNSTILELDENNNILTKQIYIKALNENFENNFSNGNYVQFNSNNSTLINLPSHANINYATMHVEGKEVYLGSDLINQSLDSGSIHLISAASSKYGQSFTIPAMCNKITSIDLWMAKGGGSGTFTEPVIMHVMKNPDDSDLETSTKQSDEVPTSTAKGWVNFDFNSLYVTPGDVYHFKPTSNNMQDDGVYGMYYQLTDVYAGGSRYSWVDNKYDITKDYKFKVNCEKVSLLDTPNVKVDSDSIWSYNGNYLEDENIDLKNKLNSILQNPHDGVLELYNGIDDDSDGFTDEPDNNNQNLTIDVVATGYGIMNLTDLRIYYDLADLSLVDITSSPTMIDNQNYTITSRINNLEGNSANNILLTFFHDSVALNNVLYSTRINISTIFNRTVEFTYTGNSSHSKIIGFVDNLNSVQEQNETNNQMEFLLGFNQAPILDNILNQTIGEGQIVTYNLNASDVNNDTLTYYCNDTRFIQNTKEFNWTTNLTDAGVYDVLFTVGDGQINDTQIVTITINNVNQAPVLDALSNQAVSEEATVTYNLNASDFDNDGLTYYCNDTRFIQNTKEFNWTTNLTDAGDYDILFTASDGQINDTQIVTVTINNVNQAPVLDALSNQAVSEEATVTYNLNASDFDNDGLTYYCNDTRFIQNTKEFNWTTNLTDAGVYDVLFTASDGQINDTQIVTVTINNVNQAPAFVTTSGLSFIAEGSIYQINLTANDADGDNLTYSVTGNKFIQNDTLFTWTTNLTDAGFYTFDFLVNDSFATDDIQVNITVSNVNQAPVLDTLFSQAINETQTIIYNLNASDFDNDNLTYYSNYTKFVQNDSEFTWTTNSTDSGVYDILFTVSDGQINDTQIITVTVNDLLSCNIVNSSIIGTEPFTVYMNASIVGGFAPYTIEWDFENDNVIDSTQQNTSNSFSAGSYIVNLTIFDNSLTYCYDTINIDVTGDLSPVANIAANITTGLSPLHVSFLGDATGGNLPISYSWDIDNDGSVEFTTQNITNIFHSSSTVNLTVVDNDGDTNSKTIEIIVVPDTIPTAIANANITSGLEILSVAFDGQVTNGNAPFNYSWDIDNNGITDYTTEDTVHNYNAGIYTSNFTVCDAQNECDSDVVVINVSLDNFVVVNISASTNSGFTPLDVNFASTILSGNSPYVYAWDFGDLGSSTQANPSHTYTSGGIYNATLTVTDIDGDYNLSYVIINVTTNIIPNPVITPNITSGLEPLDVAFTSTSNGNYPLTYQWSFTNNGTIDSILQNPVYIFPAGIHTVNLTVIDNNGDINSTTVIITSIDDSVPTAFANANVTLGVTPLNVLLSGTYLSGNAPFTFSWDIDNNGVTDYTTQNAEHTYTTGSYTANFTVCDAQSDCNSDTVVINVNPNSLVVVNITASTYSGPALLAVNFNSNVLSGDSPYTYSWNFGDLGTSTQANPSHTYTSGGLYNAILTVTDFNGDINTSQVTINVTQNTRPSVVIKAVPNPGSSPLSVSLTSIITGGNAPFTYEWDFNNDGIIDSTLANVTHIYSTGVWHTSLKVTDSIGYTRGNFVNIISEEENTATYNIKAITRDFDNPSLKINPSVIVINGVVKNAIPYAWFNVDGGAVLAITYGAAGYENKNYQLFLDNGLADCVGKSICNLKSITDKGYIFSTQCTYSTAYNDYGCYVMNNGQAKKFFYKPSENRVTIAGYIKQP